MGKLVTVDVTMFTHQNYALRQENVPFQIEVNGRLEWRQLNNKVLCTFEQENFIRSMGREFGLTDFPDFNELGKLNANNMITRMNRKLFEYRGVVKDRRRAYYLSHPSLPVVYAESGRPHILRTDGKPICGTHHNLVDSEPSDEDKLSMCGNCARNVVNHCKDKVPDDFQPLTPNTWNAILGIRSYQKDA